MFSFLTPITSHRYSAQPHPSTTHHHLMVIFKSKEKTFRGNGRAEWRDNPSYMPRLRALRKEDISKLNSGPPWWWWWLEIEELESLSGWSIAMHSTRTEMCNHKNVTNLSSRKHTDYRTLTLAEQKDNSLHARAAENRICAPKRKAQNKQNPIAIEEETSTKLNVR